MSGHSDPCVLDVVSSFDTLLDDAHRLSKILIAGGESPVGLGLDELMSVAVRQRIVALVHQADAMDIDYHSPEVIRTDNGDAHLLFGFHDRADATAFKVAFL